MSFSHFTLLPSFSPGPSIRWGIGGCPSSHFVTEWLDYIEEKKCCLLVQTIPDSELPENLPLFDIFSERFPSGEINFVTFPIPDGNIPTPILIEKWIHLVDSLQNLVILDDVSPLIMTFCRSGLGRSPTLVALYLIHRGWSNIETVTFLRKYRPHVFNHHQLHFLLRYQVPTSRCCPW